MFKMAWLAGRLDFLLFCYGLAFMLLAVLSFEKGRDGAARLPWGWLGAFGLLHGLQEWIDALLLSAPQPEWAASAGALLLAAGFFSLFEFGRRAGGFRPGWRVLPVAAFSLIALWSGCQGEALVRWTMGVPAALAAAGGMFMAARVEAGRRRERLAGAAAFIVYTPAVALGALHGGIFSAAPVIGPAQDGGNFALQLGCVVCAAATGAAGLAFFVAGRRKAYAAAAAVLLVLGGLAADRRGEVVLSRNADEMRYSASAVARAIDPEVIARLSFSGADPSSPFYSRLRGQLRSYAGAAAGFGAAVKADPELAGTRLLLMTSAGRRGDIDGVRAAGFGGYLPKPVRAALLGRCLAALIKGEEPGGRPGRILTRHDLAEPKDNVRILLVEDNQVNQQVALGMLRAKGYRADVAGNGLEALKALEEIPYDLVFMDCQMPEMDGFEASRRIRAGKAGARAAGLPVIAMTAHAMAGDRERCLAAGMDDYITKPVSIKTLSETVSRWVKKAVPSAGPAAAAVPASAAAGSSVFCEKDFLERIGGDTALAGQVLDLFLAKLPEYASGLAAAAGDKAALSAAAHSLKGAAANIGAMELRDAACRLEQASKGAAPELLAPALAAAKKAAGRLEAELRARRGGLKAAAGVGYHRAHGAAGAGGHGAGPHQRVAVGRKRQVFPGRRAFAAVYQQYQVIGHSPSPLCRKLYQRGRGGFNCYNKNTILANSAGGENNG